MRKRWKGTSHSYLGVDLFCTTGPEERKGRASGGLDIGLDTLGRGSDARQLEDNIRIVLLRRGWAGKEPGDRGTGPGRGAPGVSGSLDLVISFIAACAVWGFGLKMAWPPPGSEIGSREWGVLVHGSRRREVVVKASVSPVVMRCLRPYQRLSVLQPPAVSAALRTGGRRYLGAHVAIPFALSHVRPWLSSR